MTLQSLERSLALNLASVAVHFEYRWRGRTTTEYEVKKSLKFAPDHVFKPSTNPDDLQSNKDRTRFHPNKQGPLMGRVETACGEVQMVPARTNVRSSLNFLNIMPS